MLVAFLLMLQSGAVTDSVRLSRDIAAYVAPLEQLDAFSGVILVARGEHVLSVTTYGQASRELNVPLRPEHRFRIASVSKSFTKALAGVLAQRGALRLDDSIERWLPAFPSASRITMRMLLDHKAGVPSINSLPYDEEAIAPNTLAALVDTIARRPLDFEPGTKQRYSNGGYAVAARVIELATREPYEAVLRRMVLQPLRLNDTAHEGDDVVVANLAAGYAPSVHAPGRLARAPFQQMATKTGGGSLVSSARDLLSWVNAIGRADIMTPASWRELFPAADTGVLAMQGRSPGYNAMVVSERTTGYTAIVLANNYAAGMVGDIADAALRLAQGKQAAALRVRAPVAVDTARLGQLTGFYEPAPGTLPLPPGSLLEIRRSARGDFLQVLLDEVPLDILVPQGGSVFLSRALWSLIEFDGAAMQIKALYRNSTATAVRVRR